MPATTPRPPSSEQVAAFDRTAWSRSIGIHGRYPRNPHAVAPDLVAMVRVDRAWGLFQASFAAHDNHASYYTPAIETSGHPGDKWGWAAQLALSIKNIPTGPGDTLNIQGVYTDGATRYNFQSLATQNYAMFGGTGFPGAYQSVGFAGVTDAVFSGLSAGTATATQLETTKTWGFRGGFNHNFDPYWSGSIYGAWAQARYNNTAKGLICVGITPLLVAGSTCNPDFQVFQAGGVMRWTPVKNLTFSVDVLWAQLDQKYSGAINLPAVATKPAAVYEFKDQNTVSALFRVQRNW